MVCQGSDAAHKVLWKTLDLHHPGIPSPQALPTPSGAHLQQHSETGHMGPNQSTFKNNLFIFWKYFCIFSVFLNTGEK